MYIETQRLIIRSILRGDEKVYAEMAKDGSLTEVGFDEHFSDWAEGWIDEAIALTEKDDPRADYIPCTIVLKSTGEVIGNVGCTYYDDTDRIGICYFVGTDHRRSGYVSEAVKAYVSYFFDRYDEEEIIATIKDSNVPSWKTAENCGFRLLETKMYKDINDKKEELYRFYAFRRNDQNEHQFWPEFWALVGRDIPILYGLDAHSVDEMECRMKNAHEIRIMAIRQGHPLWDKTISFARSCSWKAGHYLAEKMQKNDFAKWERVVVVTKHDLIAGFCTLTQKDELPEDSGFSPFIGFMFVDERFRGHRISEKMIEYACNYAKELGYSKVYIMSGEQGLYEKYGFRMLGEYATIYGTTDQLFERDLL